MQRTRTRRFPLKKKRKTFGAKVIATIDRRMDQKTIFISGDISATTLAAFIPLSDIAKGDNHDERDGNQIRPISLRLMYEVITADQSNLVRVLVLVWKSNTIDVFPTDEVVLQEPATVSPLSPYNYSRNIKDFTVIYDRTHSVNQFGNGSEMGHINLFKSKLPATIKFEETGINGTGKLFIMLMSDSGIVPHPVVKFGGTFKYID